MQKNRAKDSVKARKNQKFTWKLQEKGLKEHTIVLTLYTLLTFILTYPVVFKIRTHIPGGGDAFQWIRILWYTPFAILNPDLTKLTHDCLIFYPSGIPASPFQSAFNQVVSYVLSIVTDLHVAYTILWLFSFICGAYGTYLLVKYLSNDKLASFVSGLVFAFSPYHFVHSLGHFGATSIEWIPFCALYLMKMFKEGGIRNSIFAGIFFILVAMSDLQYMIFMGIFVMLLFIYEIYILRNEKIDNKEELKRTFYKYSLFGMISFSGLVPLTIENILIALSNENFLKLDPFEAVTYSADLLSFFLPSVLHPVFGRFMEDIYKNFSGNISENTTFIGYTVVLLSLFATVRLKENKYVKFWVIAALFFSLISLGPLLHINGKTSFTVFHTTVPLPHLVLYYLIPFLDNCRTTGRFFVMASLSFAVLTGHGVSELMKYSKDNSKNLVAIVISSLIIFEYLAIPFPVSVVNQQAFYEEISQDKDSYALLEIPATLKYGAGVSTVYYQTIHGKPVIGNWAARFPSDARNFELNTPVVRELTYLQPFNVDILNQDITQVGTSILNYYNISYIVLHIEYMNDREVNLAESLIRETLNTERKTYEKDSIIVYHVKKEPLKPFIILKDNWHDPEEWGGVPTRWISNNATLMVYSNEKVNKTLSFRILSYPAPKNIEIYVEGSRFNKTIPANLIDIKIPLTLEKGENIIRFSTQDECFSPAQISNSQDTRELSFAIQNITIS